MGAFYSLEKADVYKEEINQVLAVLLGDKTAKCGFSIYGEDRMLEFTYSSRNSRYYGSFTLSEFPSNPSLLVSHELFLSPSSRGRGVAKFLQDIKMRISRDYGAKGLLCTTMDENRVQNHILETHDWKLLQKFRGNRNLCVLWYKEIPEEGGEDG